MKILELLLGYYRKNKGVALFTLILTLLYYPIDIIAISNLSSRLFLEIDSGVKQNYHKILLTVGLLLLSYLVIEIVGVLKDYLNTTNVPKFENYIREELIGPVFEKNLINYDAVETAELVHNLNKVPKILSDVFERVNRYLIPFAIIMISVSAYFFYINWKLGFLITVLFAIYSLGFYNIAKGQLDASKERECEEVRFYNQIEDILNNLFTVTLANTGQKEMRRIREISDKYNAVYHTEMVTSSSAKFTTGMAVLVLIAMCSVAILTLSKKNEIPQSGTVMAFGAIIFMSRHLRSLTRSVTETLIELGSLLGSNESLEKYGQTIIKNGNVRDFINKGEIEFKNVTFGYPIQEGQMEQNILKDFNLKKPAGQSLTIRGPSGCGKSTLVKLLNGYYSPTMGQVTIDGVDLRNVDRYYLRSVVSYLPQGTKLFDRPVIENMIYGTRATPRQAIDILKKLGVGGVFKGVDLRRNAGKHGEHLSGGQRQVVHLVRIYLSRPKLVILDEPTTGIDTEHRKYVEKAVKALSEQCDVILITHEPNLVVGEVFDLEK